MSVFQKERVGIQAIGDYVNAQLNMRGESLSVEQIVNHFKKEKPDALVNIGQAMLDSGLGLRRSSEAMERVAEKFEAKSYPTEQSIIQGIVEELSSWDVSLFDEAFSEITDDAVKFSGEVASSVGKSVKNAGKSLEFLTKNLPLILGSVAVVLGLYFFRGVKK